MPSPYMYNMSMAVCTTITLPLTKNSSKNCKKYEQKLNLVKMNYFRTLLKNSVASNFPWRNAYSTQEISVLKQSSLEPSTQTQPQTEELDKLYKLVELELKGNDKAVLESYLKFASMTAKNLEIELKAWSLKKPKHERFTMYKSVHIYKKHKAQYEFRTYFSFLQFRHLTGSTADTLLEYLQRNLPEGVGCKTTKVELQRLPEHLHN